MECSYESEDARESEFGADEYASCLKCHTKFLHNPPRIYNELCRKCIKPHLSDACHICEEKLGDDDGYLLMDRLWILRSNFTGMIRWVDANIYGGLPHIVSTPIIRNTYCKKCIDHRLDVQRQLRDPSNSYDETKVNVEVTIQRQYRMANINHTDYIRGLDYGYTFVDGDTIVKKIYVPCDVKLTSKKMNFFAFRLISYEYETVSFVLLNS